MATQPARNFLSEVGYNVHDTLMVKNGEPSVLVPDKMLASFDLAFL